MILLHKKSVLDCYDYEDYTIHNEEIMKIFHKLQTMFNYYCFVLVLDEQWKYHEFYKVIDHCTYYSNIHDIIDWFLDEDNAGIDFMLDEGNLLMISYHKKIGGLSYVKRTVAICALIQRDDDQKQIPLDFEFIPLFYSK